MADRPEKSSKATVEVRLLGKRDQNQTLPDGTVVVRKPGDVFPVERAIYEADLEPDRGMGRPAHGRSFALVSDEKAVEQKTATKRQATQDRIAAVRDSSRQQLETFEVARATAKVQEAENAKAIAESLSKPLDRPGARRL